MAQAPGSAWRPHHQRESFTLLWPECLCPSQIHVLSPKAPCGCIWNKEVITVKGHGEGGLIR